MTEILFQRSPYSFSSAEKKAFLLGALERKIHWHHSRCEPYRHMIDQIFGGMKTFRNYDDIPYLPVQIFKKLSLKSIPDEEVFKTLLSSGTTSEETSRIILDRKTAELQTKSLAHIMTSFLGPQRFPMLIVDSPSVIKDRTQFSARGAGILGMLSFGRDAFYALNNDLSLNEEGLRSWLAKYPQGPFFIFGFTFMIWKYLIQSGLRHRFQNAVLIHGGGWKKLTEESVTNDVFRQTLSQQLGIDRIHNFYGMVEQVGSIFVECSAGYLHSPSFSEVIIRDFETLAIAPHGQRGLVQVLSVLPGSYPGHSLLTEDEGTIIGDDICSCGLKGRSFLIHGRIPKAVARGCSDTFGAVA